MPWKVTRVMDMREQFIEEWLSEAWTVAALSRRHGISRKTAYKWLERYEAHGKEGLMDRSRARLHQPHAVSAAVERAILALRGKHGRWGPRKLLSWLREHGESGPLPAASTVGEILRRRGLSVPRRTRRHATPSASPLAHCGQANEVWCADFKGWFRTGDGSRCDALTIMDGHSRFLIRCQVVRPKSGLLAVRAIFEAAFRQYGLPEAIRTDNGAPFASTGLGGLTRLSVWWLQLGIRHERIEPGKPQQNGRHERMHRTLKAETASPPRRTLREQQRAFDAFRREYNEERPHEALGQATPASQYAPSERFLPERPVPNHAYPEDWQTRRVRRAGQMKWGGRDIRVTQALAGETVGLASRGGRQWEVFFGDVPLGILDERKGRIEATQRKEVSLSSTTEAPTERKPDMSVPRRARARGRHTQGPPCFLLGVGVT